MPAESGARRLGGLLAGFAGKRILVIGDLMLDEFIWGKVSRISPEAPVPVVNVTGESYYPGGAANVARNLREFTAARRGHGAGGRGRARASGWWSCWQAAGIDTSGVQRDPAFPTTVKTRIIARNQQVVRVDRERKAPLTAAAERRAPWSSWTAMRPGVDAIIVADYGKGFLTQPLADPSVPHGARARQDPDGGPASAHVALLARRHGHQAEPRRGVSGGRPAALRSGDAGACRPGAAGGGEAAAAAVGKRGAC